MLTPGFNRVFLRALGSFIRLTASDIASQMRYILTSFVCDMLYPRATQCVPSFAIANISYGLTHIANKKHFQHSTLQLTKKHKQCIIILYRQVYFDIKLHNFYFRWWKYGLLGCCWCCCCWIDHFLCNRLISLVRYELYDKKLI